MRPSSAAPGTTTTTRARRYHEAQAAYLRQALVQVRERAAAAIDVRPDAEAVSDRDLQARFTGTAWTRCDSWYRNDGGRIVANWPGYMREYAERTAVLDPDEYTFAVGLDQPSPRSISSTR